MSALYALQPPETTDPGWSRLRGERGAVRAAQARCKRLGQPVSVVRLGDPVITTVYTANPPAAPLKS